MMNDKDKLLNSGLLEQYVLGLLEDHENLEIEENIHRFPELKQHVNELQEAMEQVLIQNAIQAPPQLKENILREIEQLEQATISQKVVPTRNLSWIPALAATVALLMTAMIFFRFRSTQQQLAQLNTAYHELQADCTQNQAFHQALQAQYQFVTNVNTKHVHLTGTKIDPHALAVIYWNESEAVAYLDVLNLPEPDSGKEYQLWADVEGNMINIGGIKAENRQLQAITYIQKAESLNVTIEDIGQNKKPTVEQLIISGKI
ncbi:MAG: anti-sigma factor [Saprospiraceae bacterium]|nr:anti-sigma factor [Saprospiraceae bacterium]